MKRIRAGGLLAAALALWSTAAGAEVVRIEITSREPMNNGQAAGAAGPFELLRGKVHGEIDPLDPHNRFQGGVRSAAEQAVRDRFLLPEDATRILQEADGSDILKPPAKTPEGGVAVLLVDTDRVAGTIDERIYGHFLEEINHSVVDGLYAEQVRGQGFEGKDFADYWT